MTLFRTLKRFEGLLLAVGISYAILALSYLRTIGDANSAKFGRGVIEAVLDQPIWGTKLASELVQFGLAVLLMHTLLALICFALARLTLIAWPDNRNSIRSLTVLWMAACVIWVLAANAFWYPKTALGSPYTALVSREILGLPLFGYLTAALAAAMLAVVATAVVRRRATLFASRLVWTGGAVCLAAGIAMPAVGSLLAAGDRNADRPHIILIGLDSLRMDFVDNEAHRWTPAIDAFVGESLQFTNTVTPLARTFPAWASLISGQHPHTTGAFVNLLPRDMIDTGETLPELLSAEGYETIYAIDEVRFSNLDLSYGFDRMLAPPMGSADFMLEFFSDTPLANILANTTVGKWFFPYAYANRGAAKTYDPDAFVGRLSDGVSFREPTFLAAHLTLAHWPYTWAMSPDPADPDSASITKNSTNRGLYEVAIDRLDRQFGDLMQLLQRKGALEHAIVVVFSDHGESLGEASPVLAHAEESDLPFPSGQLFGHGTHVFSPDQYDILLSFRSYGSELMSRGSPGAFAVPATLEDLAPTLLDLLDIESSKRFDGISLASYLRGNADPGHRPAPRVRYLETEFNPPGISTDQMLSVSAIMSAAETYEIDPDTDRVIVDPANVHDILAKRQYAVERDGRYVAAVPAPSLDEQYVFFFDPAEARLDWLDRAPSEDASSEASVLWQELTRRFSPVAERRVVPPPEDHDDLL